MNKQFIDGISYIIQNDNDLLPLIHPCSICDVEDKCISGHEECKTRKIHFVLKRTDKYYKNEV